MDAKTKCYFTYLFYLCLLIGAVILCFNSPDRLIALAIYAVFSASMISHHLIYFKDPPRKGSGFLVVILAVALGIQYYDNTIFAGFYIIILIAYALFVYEARLSMPFTIFAVLAHVSILFYKSHMMPSFELLRHFSTFGIPRALLIALIVILQHITRINIKNKLLTESLREKTDALETALGQLSAYADELQKNADSQARDRLMHELHDKLGHIMATASIAVQAAVVLLDKDPPAAKARLDLVAQQIQEAMQSLREMISGRTISYIENESSFTQSLISLMGETEKRTGIPIAHNLRNEYDEDYAGLSGPKRSFIYNALMEGLTNGIRHGAAARFDFSLTIRRDRVLFYLRDNGTGFKNITFGYGLSKMLGDAKRFGAEFDLNGQNGCTLEICLPIESQVEIGDRDVEQN